MSTHADHALLAALAKISGTGNFCSTGSAPFFLPGLGVAGVGELAFPLPAAQARELIAVAEAAPYGKGEKTVLDAGVRRCWQIDAKRLSFHSAAWKKFLQQTVARVAGELGIEGKVSASPYKLLIYEKDGHFKPHRDTEKLEAMFGTLIIALPSAHEGGRLLVRHGGREIAVDFSEPEHWRDFQFAALFADCEHEVEPVRSGYRCCLVYNLRLEKGDPAALNLALDAQAKRLLPALRSLARARSGELSAVLLEHSYTEANFSLAGLKGHDRARSRALLAAARELGLAAHLGLVTFHQMGSLDEEYDDYDYNYSRRNSRRRGKSRYHDDEEDDDGEEDASDEGEMGEVFEESLSVSHWRDERDLPADFGNFSLDKDEVISKKPLGEGKPDEKEGEGYTGNAGCTMEYWYRRAAVVLWAREAHETILCGHDFDGACRLLSKLARGDAEAFQRLARAVVARFPEKLPHPNVFKRGFHSSLRAEILGHLLKKEEKDDEEGDGAADTKYEDPFSRTLGALARAGACVELETLRQRVPAAAFGLCDVARWVELLRAFGAEAFAPVFEELLAGEAEETRSTLVGILAALIQHGEDPALCRTLATWLASLAPRPARSSWDESRELPPGDVTETRVLLLASPWLTAAKERKKALAFVQGDGSLEYLRQHLAPVLLEKPVQAAAKAKGSLIPEARAWAVSLLAAEVARPLTPYPDWARPFPASKAPSKQDWGFGYYDVNKGELWKELQIFMEDSKASTHDFQRRQDERAVLERWIKEHCLDLKGETIRKGSPHTLRCVKNDASYHQALKVRAQDEALLKKLR